jgi:hypothetical protein
MGILDEAIRAHLELMREKGATADELKRLEDEAFGPPTRPGDPDFPDREGESPANGDGAAETEVATAEPPEPSADLPPDEEAAEAPPETAESTATPPTAPVVEEEALAAPPADEPSDQPVAPEEATGDEATAFYDHTRDAALDLGELELELDEELEDAVEEPAAPPADETAERPAHEPAPAEPESAEPPIESLDTVEHQIEEAPGPAEGETEEPPADREAPADQAEEGGEDVLEETPDFLADAPEDDELWFEQGEPKDFDF